MTRPFVTVTVVVCLLALLAAPAAAHHPSAGSTAYPERNALSPAPAPLNVSETETNETKTLREENKKLRTKNSKLQTDLAGAQSRVKELEFQLSQSDNSDIGALRLRMKELGAWDPHTNDPKVVIVRDHGFGPVVYQFVGPGNGHHSFNGQSAWAEVARPKEDVRYEGNFSFTLEYALPGMETAYTVGSFGEYRSTLSQIEGKLNSPAGFAAWARYTNERRHSAETTSTGSTVIVIGLTLVGLVGAAWAESQKHWFYNRRRNKQDREHRSPFQGDESSSVIDRFRGGS